MNPPSPFRLKSCAFSTSSKFTFSDEDVFGRKFMTISAMSFPRLVLANFSTATIYDVGYRFEMRWINAAMNSAKMIKFKSFWNRTCKQFVNDSVSFLVKRAFMNLAIFSSLNGSDPQPAIATRFNMNLVSQTLGKSVKTQHTDLSMAERLCWGQFAFRKER
jgi:hypothetical protein